MVLSAQIDGLSKAKRRLHGYQHLNLRACYYAFMACVEFSPRVGCALSVPTVIVRQPFIPKFRPFIRCRAQAEFHRVKFVVKED